MRWLDLDWDGDAVYQFARAGRHAEVAHDLLARGAAYRCYLTQAELAAMRAEAQDKRVPFRVRSPWRARTNGDPAAPHVIDRKSTRLHSGQQCASRMPPYARKQK